MSTNRPLISIITVVYNGGSVIEQTIKSVIEQPYKNIEYLIIDGASQDDTVSVIKKYEDKVTHWISEPDKGIYDAMNKGWAEASNESYVLFLGAGDRIIRLPNLSAIALPDIVYGNVQIGKKRIFPATADIRLRLGNTVHHQALLVKKSVHPNPPFSLDYPTYADFDFNQRLLRAGKKFIKDENFLAYALEGGASEEFKRAEALKIVQKNYGSFWVLIARLYYFLQTIYYPLKYKAV
jgi:glycosyltransferase involved in cell wall biosynthesis